MKQRGGKPLALVGVFIGAAGFAASLTCVYRAMRDLMINSGGACASGGPYAINPGQECTPGQTGLLIGGIFAGLIFAGLLIGSSGRYGGFALSGVGLILWAALFGTLGFNFIQLGFDPPPNLSGGETGWIICGIVFWLMALGGLIPGLMGIASYFKHADDPPEKQSSFDAPIVRANVEFVRSMPGDPAFGQSNPAQMQQADAAAAAAEQAPPREASTAEDFVDPVTGERHGGNDG